MTATSEIHRTKKSKGFTIDCIMGRDTDGQTDKHRSSPECSVSSPPLSRISHPGLRDVEREPSVFSVTSDRHSTERTPRDVHERTHERVNERLQEKPHESSFERTHGHLDSERLKNSEMLGLHPKFFHKQSSGSLNSDKLRDINFSNVNVREGIQSATSPDALRQFHEVLLQNAGAPNPGVGMSVSPFDAQRPFRHPLSQMGLHGYPGQPMTSHPQVHPMLLNGVRDLRHMYPYITDRYPGCFLPRYGMAGMPGLFFQPYRKPKRIRTAFSPSQLLQLEKSFEKSHYVVGQERKDLANELQLSETQVKVWFQNRRTKYKRTKSEGEEGGSSNEGHDTSHGNESPDESDISDIDDIDDETGAYQHAHAYHNNPIQTC